MYTEPAHTRNLLGEFKTAEVMLRYSSFVPRLYNMCVGIGFEPGKIMPSRAFCSDENQGYPIILIAKHFGAFPFNHGRVGGVVSTDRHGPHAGHGKDLVIINASHVGYDPATARFGVYRRMQANNVEISKSCGKIAHVLEWYQDEYRFACANIRLLRKNGAMLVSIDNQLLNANRASGLFLHMAKLARPNAAGMFEPVSVLSTAKIFPAATALAPLFSSLQDDESSIIGNALSADFFYFKKPIAADPESHDHLEQNLFHPMPWIVTAAAPMLVAAQVNTQVEFDRTYRTIAKAAVYSGRNVVYISGIHIDISPSEGQIFPLTKFVPWAAYVQPAAGTAHILEQRELYQALMAADDDNPDQIDLEQAIHIMEQQQEVKVEFSACC